MVDDVYLPGLDIVVDGSIKLFLLEEEVGPVFFQFHYISGESVAWQLHRWRDNKTTLKLQTPC